MRLLSQMGVFSDVRKMTRQSISEVPNVTGLEFTDFLLFRKGKLRQTFPCNQVIVTLIFLLLIQTKLLLISKSLTSD